jgi:hypothetical protein
MKNGVNRFHRKCLLDFYNEKINHFFIRLQKINRIVTLTDKYLTIFTWQKFDKFLVDESWVPEFKRTVH